MTISFPRDRAAGTHDDSPTHAAKLEEWELYAFPYGVAQLGSPAGIAVGGKTVVLMGRGRNGIGVCFSVRGRRERHECMEGGCCLRCKCKTIIDSRMNIVKRVQSSVPVTFGGFVVVSQKE